MNIEAKELSKIYGSGESRVVALDKVNLEIASSDFISIMGPSVSYTHLTLPTNSRV